MELDLNEEPCDQIEERIRRLEGVIFRSRQRQRWRRGHTPIEITNFAGELITSANVQDEGRVHQEEVDLDDLETGMVESGGKRKASYLIAKALGMRTYASEEEGCSCTGNFFDCNICLSMARDPVLTCCGHLFCWSCFYRLSYAYSNTKECPVCKGAVTETGIIPVYGNASVNICCQSKSKDSESKVPARPQAHRIESIGQQFRNRGASSTIQDILRFGNFFGGLGERAQLEIPTTATDRTNGFATQSSLETENDQHIFSHQFSRLVIQGASSFSSLSASINSAMDSAERLFDELESYIRSHPIGSIRQLSPHAVHRDSPFSIAVTNQSDSHTQDVAATSSAAASSVSPLNRSDDDINAVPDSNIR